MDLYNLVVSAKLTKGGGGGDIDVDELSVTENGTYTALSGHAYSPVIVDVPNSYDVSDEGKVVSNGALVGQTSATKTANGTYDTTLNNEVVVNVPSVTPTGNINITSTAQTDVSAYATAQVVDADLVAGNIKKDVDILGVTGTYEGGGGGGGDATLAALLDKSIVNLVVPGATTGIGLYSVYNCPALETVVVEEGPTKIDTGAFSGASALKSVDLPSSITNIGSNAFADCRALQSFTIRNSTPPRLDSSAFNRAASDFAIFVPASSVEAYKAASNWSSRAAYIQAIPE